MKSKQKGSIIFFRLALTAAMLVSMFAMTPASSAKAAPPLATICYVDVAAPNDLTGNDGTTWPKAYRTALGLQDALADPNCDQIWVAAGTYLPGPGTNRSDTFQLKNGVVLYGGFAGTETSVSQRDIITNETILSGGSESSPQFNAYHVVNGSGTDNTAILDGFTVANGYANGTDTGENLGGGMYISYGSPSIYNVTFRNNYAANGGGLFTTNSSAGIWGVIFDLNTANYGAGVYNHYSTTEFGNVTFLNNQATQNGGAILNTSGNATFTHITVTKNTAKNGSGIYISNSSPAISNSIFWDNTSSVSGNQIDTVSSSAAVKESVVEGGYAPGRNIITDNPFLGSLKNNGGRMETISIRQDSSARDAASLNDCPYTDQRGLNRPQGTGCDIGAYEFQDVLYVVPTGGRTSGFCQSWSFACDLQYALRTAFTQAGQQIWVKAGTYVPFSGPDRSATFSIGHGEQMYGGFAGTETSLGQRNYQDPSNKTTLSGEIGTASLTDNVFHVVTNDYCFYNYDKVGTLLDGFTIERGYANGGGDDNNGGGIYADGCVLIRNVIVKNNYAASYGGGIWSGGTFGVDIENSTIASNQASSGGGIYDAENAGAKLTNVRFIQNSATSVGGGMFTFTEAKLTDVTFTQNTAPSSGGGLYIQGGDWVNLSRVIFDRNTTKGQGGGLYSIGTDSPTLTDITFIENTAIEPTNHVNGQGGGMAIVTLNSYPPQIKNLTFENNQADKGGGLYYSGGSNNYADLLVNATFVGNSAQKGGGVFFSGPTGTMNSLTMKDNVSTLNMGPSLYYENGYLEIENSIFWSNSLYPEIFNLSVNDEAYVSDSIVRGGYDGYKISTDDPLLGTLSANGGFTKTVPLLPGSAALNAATFCRSSEDQRGVTRPQGSHCDIGAFEYDPIPEVVSITRADPSPTNAPNIDFIVTFSEPVTGVDKNDFALTLSGATGASVATSSGSGTTYTVTVNTGLGNGTIRLDLKASGTGIQDTSGNPISGGFTGGQTYTIQKDVTAPSVTSITRAAGSPTNAASVNYTVSFSETVTGVDKNDFALTLSGVTGASVAASSGSGTTYTVTVNTGSGNGTIRLDLKASGTGIQDLAGNPISGGFTSGETYAIQKDSIAPNVTSITRTGATPTNATSVDFTVTFSETVTGVDKNDFALTLSGVTGASVAASSGSGTTYTITVNTGSGNGTIRLDLKASSTGIQDLAGNPISGDFTSGETYAIIKDPTFNDVPASHWAFPFIEAFYYNGITSGCGSGNYCPNRSVTRAEMAIFLLRGIHGSSYTPPAAKGNVFNDIPATFWAAAWIEQFYKEGITSGCGGGNYCPNRSVTRAEMAIFLLRAKYTSSYTPPAAKGNVFNDIPATFWAGAWVEQLYKEGITSGCSGGNYCPNRPVTRAEMAIFINRTFNLTMP